MRKQILDKPVVVVPNPAALDESQLLLQAWRFVPVHVVYEELQAELGTAKWASDSIGSYRLNENSPIIKMHRASSQRIAKIKKLLALRN